jgi:hypothetical protein
MQIACFPCCMISSVAFPTLLYFSTLTHKQHDLQKEVLEHKMCVLIFSAILDLNTSHSKKNSARYYSKCKWVFHVKFLLFLSDFNETQSFMRDFLKSSSMKFPENCQFGAMLFHADRWADRYDE